MSKEEPTKAQTKVKTSSNDADRGLQKPKSLGNTEVSGARKNVSDLVVWGDGDSFQLICKASSKGEGWMKSTKALEIPAVGVVLQVTTQQRNPDGSYSVAEALTNVPGAKIKEEYGPDGKMIGRRLVHIS